MLESATRGMRGSTWSRIPGLSLEAQPPAFTCPVSLGVECADTSQLVYRIETALCGHGSEFLGGRNFFDFILAARRPAPLFYGSHPGRRTAPALGPALRKPLQGQNSLFNLLTFMA